MIIYKSTKLAKGSKHLTETSEEFYREDLKTAWVTLTKPYGVSAPEVIATFARLAEAYGEPGRYYHTLKHIWHVLQTVNSLQNGGQSESALQLAAFFHDVIYDSHAADNEEKSAEYAQAVLQSWHVPAVVIDLTAHLIICTKAHHAEPADFDAQILLDADLAILGTSPNAYQIYAQAIRQEYGWVTDENYRAGRKAVLENFLKRERLYYTNQLYQALEAQARQNLATEIALLTA